MRKCLYQRAFVIVFAWFYLSLASTQATAAAVPTYNGKMNNAVGGVIGAKLSKWGFAANDPRINATAAGIGSGLTTVAIGVATGAVATVGWPALLVGAGITALVGGAVSLAQDALIKWLFNSDGTVTQPAVTNALPPLASGKCYRNMITGGACYASVSDVIFNGSKYSHPSNTNQYGTYTYWLGSLEPLSDGWYQIKEKGNLLRPDGTNTPFDSTTYSARVAVVDAGTATIPAIQNPDVLAGSTPASTKPLADAIAALTDADRAKPISDELLAAAANTAWKAASMGSGAVPWSASDPITPADVATWKTANPSMVPTVGDAIAPVSSGSTVSVGAGTSTLPTVTPTPGSGEKVDLGPDPNIPAPTLEATPTAQQILSPVLSLMPDLKSFAVPSHASTCPTGSFTAFQKVYTFDSHCSLIEYNRSLIEAASILVWALAAIFIVLRA